MGSPLGYLMAHVIMNYALDKALGITLLNRGRQFMTRQQILSGPRSLPAQTYEVFVDFKSSRSWLPAEFSPTCQMLTYLTQKLAVNRKCTHLKLYFQKVNLPWVYCKFRDDELIILA